MFRFIFDKQNLNFFRLWWAQLISQFGDRIHQMALVGLIAQRSPGSAMDLAKLLAFTIIPVFIVGPIAGVFVDRWDRRTTLFVCDFIRAGLVLTIPFVFIYKASMVPIYTVVFFVFCFSRFYVPAKMSIIPELVEEKELLVANSLITTTGMIAFVGGISLGGFLVEHFGSRMGFVWNAATFLTSGILIFSIPHNVHMRGILTVGKEMVQVIKKSIWEEAKDGLNYIIHHRDIRFILNMIFILLAAAGAVYVVIIVFIQKTFQSVTKDLSILAVFLGLGLFLGTILYGKFGKRVVWYKTIFFCLMLGGTMIALFAFIVDGNPNLWLAAGLVLVLGLVIGPIFIAANTVTQSVSDAKMLGKVFTAVEIVIHFAFLAAMFLSSWASQFFRPAGILITVGIFVVIVGLIGFLRYPKPKLAHLDKTMA